MQNQPLCTVILTTFIAVLFCQNLEAAGPMGESVAPPPVRATIDKYGIDLLSWQPGVEGMKVKIGAEGSGIASLSGRQRYTTDNHTGTLTEVTVYNSVADSPELYGVAAGTYRQIDVLGHSELFSISGGSYTNYKQTGGSLTCTSTTCTYVNKEGVVVLFEYALSSGYAAAMPCGCFSINSAGEKVAGAGNNYAFYKNLAQVKTITHPNGEIISYSYITIANYSGKMINAVSSSMGWMLKYFFSDKTSTWSSNNTLNVASNRSIKAINTSVEYCSPASRHCNSTQNTWPTSTMQISSSVFYGPNVPIMPGDNYNPQAYNRSTSSEVTDPLGFTDSYGHGEGPTGATNIYYTPGGILHKYYIPGMAYYNGSWSTTTLTGRVRLVTIGNQSFDYYYDTKVTPEGTVLTDNGKRYITSFKDNLNREQRYTYEDTWGYKADKIINPDATPSISAPSGGYEDYDYDSRGNTTTVTTYPKNSGTPLVVSAKYPITCTNIKTCNKPEAITDQNGVTTTYTYHPQSGYVETVTKPSVNGVQAQKRYKYEQKTPYVKNSSGNLIASAPVWVLTEISECMSQTLNTCVGNDDEKRTVYSDFTNNLLPQKMTVQNGNGSIRLETIKEYDNYGNITASDGPRPGTEDKIFYFYDLKQQQIGEIGIDPDGSGPLLRKATKSVYNGDGKITSVETGVTSGTTKAFLDTLVIRQKYETEYSTVHGLPIVERVYAGGILERVTQKSYNSKLLLDCVAQRLNRNAWSSLPESACTPGAAGSEGNDRIVKYNYDLTGVVLSIVSGYGTAMSRADRTNTYSPINGLLTAEADGKGNKTLYKYDDFNRPFKTVYPQPNNGTQESTSDYVQTNYKTGSSLVDSIRLRDGLVINFPEYDALARPKRKSGALNESYMYNNFNNIVSRTNNSTGGVSQTSAYVYNSLGWLKSESRVANGASLGSVTYAYDSYGRRSSLTWPDNFSILYDYKVNGVESEYLRKITESNGTTLATFDYYDNGRRKSLIRGNGVITTYGYNDLLQLTSQSTDVGGANTADDITEAFQFYTSGQLKSHALTVNNNNYIFSPQALSTTTYVPDGLNRITSVNAKILTYDGRGNLASDASEVNANNISTTYTYNANNLMLNSTKEDVTTSLSYDAENRLYSVTKSGSTTKFMYDGTDLIAETNSSNTILRRYVHDPMSDTPIVWYEGAGTSDRRYYTTNRQGSIVGVTLQNGMSTSVNAYDEYGNQKLASIGRFQFTGQAWIPEIGLYYYKARFYNPRLGRFMQTDPIGYKDGMNWYAYAGNDPINKIDPKGLYQCNVTGYRKTCEGTASEVSEMKAEMKGYKIDGATSGFLSPEGKEKIDATFSFAKENNKDLNFGKSYKVKDLGGATKGLVLIPGISKMVLDDRYLKKLDMNQMVDLLNTIIHEGLHRTLSLWKNMKMGMDHPEIYEEADRRTNMQRNDFETYIKDKFQ